MSTSVLFVCLGNICRSPAAEGLARVLAPQGYRFDSAGTAAYHVGNPPDSRMRRLFKSKGHSIEDLRARQVQVNDFQSFDWIVAMDVENFRNLRQIQPAHSRAKLVRMMDYAPELGLDSVPDPYYGDDSDFEQVYQILDQALSQFFTQISADSL